MSWSKELELEFFDSCFNTTFNFSYTYYMFYTAKTRTKKTSIPLSNSNYNLQLLLDSCNRCCVLPCANLV